MFLIRLCLVVLTLIWLPVQAGQIKAVTELFYPYQLLDEENELTGYAVDVVSQLADFNGHELSIELLPWSVAYQKALSSPGTLIFSIGKNQERAALFHWIGPIAGERLYFWALPSSKIPASEDIFDFRHYRFAVIKDATTHQFLSANGFENLYVMGGTDSNASEESRIQMLIKARADIVISTASTVAAAIDTLGLEKGALQRVHRAKRLDSELYVAFSKSTDGVLVENYQNAMQHLIKNNVLTTLAKKWEIDL